MIKSIVERPLTYLMIFATIILMGVLTLSKFPISFMPDIDLPKLTVITQFPDAAGEEVESLVTKKIEESVGSINSLRNIYSESENGISKIYLVFEPDVNIDFIAAEVREKIDLIKSRLPDETRESVIQKYNPNKEAIISLGVTSNEYGINDIYRFAKKYIVPEIQRIKGVADVNCIGGSDKEIRVIVDSSKLKAYNVSIGQIITSLELANVSFRVGTIEEGNKEYLIRAVGEYENLNNILNTVIEMVDEKKPVFIKDIANVTSAYKVSDFKSKINNQNGIIINIKQKKNGNTVFISKETKMIIERLNLKKYEVKFLNNRADFIKNNLDNIKDNMIQGALLSFIILILFLGELRSSIIVLISIPVSILITFFVMYLCGFTLNSMTLGGIALSIGMIVDCTIVVLENIDRWKEKQSNLKNAVLNAVSEISLPVIASTITSIIVFLPVFLYKEQLGKMFTPQVFSITVTLVASLIVALIMIPALSMLFSKKNISNKIKLSNIAKKYLEWISAKYIALLSKCIKHRNIVLLISFLLIIIFVFNLTKLKRVIMPEIDQGMILLESKTPIGSPLIKTEQIAQKFTEKILSNKNIDYTFSVIGEEPISGINVIKSSFHNKFKIFAKLKDFKYRKNIGIKHIKQQLYNDLKNIDSSISFSIKSFGNLNYVDNLDFDYPINITLFGKDYKILKNLINDIRESLYLSRDFSEIISNTDEKYLQLKLNVDRLNAASCGLTVKEIIDAAYASLNGKKATNYRVNGEIIDVNVKLDQTKNKNLLLKDVKIKSPFGMMFSLNKFVEVKYDKPSRIYEHINLQKSITLKCKLTHSNDETKIYQKYNAYLSKYNLPNDYFIKTGGFISEMKKNYSEIFNIIIFAITLIYLCLVAQFESFLQPFLIMIAIPFAFIGVSIGLWLFSVPLSILTGIGILVLSGITVNSSIILIDYFNKKHKSGMETAAVIYYCCRIRFRPILMTVLTTIIGMIPLAMATGEGKELSQAISITIIFGLFVSTVFTLFIVPIIYSFKFKENKNKVYYKINDFNFKFLNSVTKKELVIFGDLNLNTFEKFKQILDGIIFKNEKMFVLNLENVFEITESIKKLILEFEEKLDKLNVNFEIKK